MLTVRIVLADAPTTPQNLWASWNTDPLLIIGLLAAAWIYRRGQRRLPAERVDRWRTICFLTALALLGVALLSPLDAAAAALASAHMVQHVLLVLVVAPLLTLSGPSTVLLLGIPRGARRPLGRLRKTIHGMTPGADVPVWLAAWLLHAATLWLWHAAALYDAALEHPLVHAAEHASFLLTALLFWHVVLGARGALRVSPGLGILLVFGMGMASTFLSVLLTFARTPWYAEYAATTRAWGLEPLADQQLAGVIMWVPAGFVYVAAALALLAAWIRQFEDEGPAPAPIARPET